MPGELRSINESINAVIDWLLRAQQVTPDDGVAESYNPITRHWRSSYPETTGYIICSLLRAADAGFDHDDRLIKAATKMGRWLVTTQFPSGAFPGGTIGTKNPAPTLFNTGQILKGLTDLIVRNLDKTGELRQAAARAAQWMIEIQDTDGAWRTGRSHLTSALVHAYDVRAAWALARYGQRLDDHRAMESAVDNCRWVCSIQKPNGWFDHMNFDIGSPPLTHTIAYTIQGLLEIGALISEMEFISRARLAASAVFTTQDPTTGAMPGQFEENWQPIDGWTSTTGNAQMAIIGYRLASLTGEALWRDKARLVTDFCRRLQEFNHPDSGRRGAVRGSYPGHLGYGRYWYMNWTQKFYLDALLCEMGVDIV